MITLNGERGLESVGSWDDVLQLPGFTEKLDPKEHELKEIVGRYIFKDRIPCGLTSCRQPHGTGYIVCTKSGPITNIGNGCGKTHFGVEFKQASRVFDRAITEQNNRESIGTFLFQIDEHIKNASELRETGQGADWVNKHAKSLATPNKGCPVSTVERVQRMVRSRDSSILIDRLASKEEVEDLEAIENRKIEMPHYIQESVGTLAGLSALYPENDLRKIVVVEIQENLNFLQSIDIDSLRFDELRHWSKWCSEFEGLYEKSVEIVDSGRSLLAENNLKQLHELLDDKNEKLQFEKYLKLLKSSM